MLDDLFQPCEFVASHQYSPWWTDVADFKVNCCIPFSPLVFSFGTGSPSLYQMTTGLGKLDALQLTVTSLPADTYIWGGGLTIKRGGDGSEKTKWYTWKRKFDYWESLLHISSRRMQTSIKLLTSDVQLSQILYPPFSSLPYITIDDVTRTLLY